MRLTAEVGKPKWTGFSTISDTAASDWLNSAMLASDWFNSAKLASDWLNSAMLRLIGPFRKIKSNCYKSRKLSLCHWTAQILKKTGEGAPTGSIIIFCIFTLNLCCYGPNVIYKLF